MSSKYRTLSRWVVAAAFVVSLLALVPPSAADAAGRVLAWPVEGRIVRGFERPTGPYGEGGHQGIDIAAEPGSPVRAAGDGTVAWTGELPRGRFISIEHPGGVRTTYLDMAGIGVARGRRVRSGEVIGSVCGSRDTSSAVPHIHFDTFLDGEPVDPRLMLGELDMGSFVRLCPVDERVEGSPVEGGPREPHSPRDRHLTGPRPGELETVSSRRDGGVFDLLKSGLSSVWDGVGAAGGAFVSASGYALRNWVLRPLEKATSFAARVAGWVWSNRYVQAVAAGLAAALVVVVLVVAAFFLLPISAVTAAIAAVAGVVACVAAALYCAFTAGPGFGFGDCFFTSLTVGLVAAAGALSLSALTSAVAAGWAEVGLSGALKAAAWNGLFSAGFEAAVDYTFNGQFTLRRVVTAFLIGAVTGGVGKVLRAGISGNRLLGLLRVSTETRFGSLLAGRSAVLYVRGIFVRVQGVLVVVKGLTLTFGGKVAYVAMWGSLTSGLDIAARVIAGRPLTLSGLFASFIAGVAMGGIALIYGGRGLSGFLERVRLLREHSGPRLRGFLAKLLSKAASKGLRRTTQAGFEELLDEKEVSR